MPMVGLPASHLVFPTWSSTHGKENIPLEIGRISNFHTTCDPRRYHELMASRSLAPGMNYDSRIGPIFAG